MFELSASQICCFSRHMHSMYFRISYVPGEPLDWCYRLATASMVMLFWYKVRIVSKRDLLFLEMYRFKDSFENRMYQEHRSMGFSPCTLYQGHDLLIHVLNFLLFLQMYALNVFSKIVCTRRTTRRVLPSCHLFHGHGLLVHRSNSQRDKSAVSRDILN